jgi:glutamate racemase
VIGIFDSGVGGCVSLAELRAINGEVDIVYLADYKNAPYGTKGEGELVPIISENIERLLSLGCERVLIACCTASAMHRLLPEKIREKSPKKWQKTPKFLSI